MKKLDRKPFYTILFPTVVEVIFNQMFAMVDNIMIGHIPDSTIAVAALSLCQPIINLVVCVMTSFFIGTTAVIAWYVGAKDENKVNETAQQSLVIAVILGVVISLITFIFSSQIVGFVCGGSETFEIAKEYYRINAIGFFFQTISLCITASFRGKGITKIPMIYNITGNGMNVILNYILIYGKLGFAPMFVKGAAIATVCAKGIIFVFSGLFFALYKKGFSLKREYFSLKFAPQVKHKMLRIGLTSACEQLILQAGATCTARIISVLPTKKIAALQIVQNLEAFAWSSGDACCTAITSLFGKSLGEQNSKKARDYFKLSEIWALIFSAIEILIFCFGGNLICRLFTNDVSIYKDIVAYLMIAAVGLPFINTHKTISGALRGAGDSVAPLIASLVSLWVFRVLLSYILISVLHSDAVAYRWCLNADQFIRMIAMMIFYLTNHWQKYTKED